MSAHLSPAMLNGLIDEELSVEQLAAVQQHLEACPTCTSTALAQSLLKRAVARSGYRYAAAPDLAARVRAHAALPAKQPPAPAMLTPDRIKAAGWVAAVVLAIVTLFFVQSGVRPSHSDSAVVTEVCDLHVASMAAGMPLQIVSTDRHTVKPWFQGKLPFSFNLPQDLPADVKLEGANLIYLQNQPVAQLVYSIGRHHASVFLRQKIGSTLPLPAQQDHSGFHVIGLSTRDLHLVTVSDVDAVRLTELATIIKQAQT